MSYSIWWILLLASLTALGPLSIDMYLPALPVMAQQFGVSTTFIANSLPAYFLGLAIGQLIYGPLSDRIGRKTPLYIGLSLFVLGSVCCVFAHDAWMLITARILQALGGCVGIIVARAAIRDRLTTEQAVHAFSTMMIVMSIAPVLAPTLGAIVLKFAPWQAIFIILAIFGTIALFNIHFFFKETLDQNKRHHLSFHQILLLYIQILKDKTFVFPMLAGCLTGGVMFVYISSATHIFMEHYQLSGQTFAYIFGANAVGISLFSMLNKRLTPYFSIKKRLLIGSSLQFLGIGILCCSNQFSMVLLGIFLAVSSNGLCGPNATALAMEHQGMRAGTASAVMGAMQFFMGLSGGLLLNFLNFNATLNMALIMLLYSVMAILVILFIRQK